MANFISMEILLMDSLILVLDNWIGVEAKSGTSTDKNAMKLSAPLPYGVFVSNHSAQQAYEKVLEFAGASFKRDAIDARIINETRTGTFSTTGSRGSTNGFIDSQSDAAGWPVLASATLPGKYIR
jgi:hypothetical protein